MKNIAKCAAHLPMLLICCVPSNMGAQGLPREERNAPLPEIAVQTFDTWFRELPAYARVTITNSGRALKIPVWTPWGHMPIAIALAGTNGQEVVSLLPAGIFLRERTGIGGPGPEPPLPKPTRLLVPGEVLECLIDLSFCLAHLGRVEGPHHITLRLLDGAGDALAESAPLNVRIAERPEEKLKPILSKVTIARGGIGVHGLTQADLRSIDDGALRGTLACALLLDRLQWAETFAGFPMSEFPSGLPSWVQPWVDELRFEVLTWNGETARARELKQSLGTQSKALQEWLDKAEAGEGLLEKDTFNYTRAPRSRPAKSGQK